MCDLDTSSLVFWAAHAVHHSPEQIGLGTSVRVPWMEALYKPWFSLWMPLLGFPPVYAIVFDAIASTIALFQHTPNTRSLPMVGRSLRRARYRSHARPHCLRCRHR